MPHGGRWDRSHAADIRPTPHHSSNRRGTSMRRAVSMLVLSIVLSGCPASRADVAISEQIIQLGDGLNDLRQDNAVLQQQVDSLRAVVAKQDSVIRQIANLSGFP